MILPNRTVCVAHWRGDPPGAAILNGLRVVGKNLHEVKFVSTGGGAAGIACLKLLVGMGLPSKNVWLVDKVGVVYAGRAEEMTPEKAVYAQETKARTLADVIDSADVFLRLSAPNILTPPMLKRMAPKPLILALANPVPEIMPDIARAARPDAVIATGRSDFPNQVNNVLCFPFVFRGALDAGATTINEAMKVAALQAIADLATAESSEVVARAYASEELRFGPNYLIPKPFDPRLIVRVAPAVAKAAMESGVATRPVADLDAYTEALGRFVFRSGLLMKPVFERARQDPKRLAYAEGEDERVLRAVQDVLDEGLARPILVGRPEVIRQRIDRLGLRMELGPEVEVVNPADDARYEMYWRFYHSLVEREGISPAAARTLMRTNTTVIAAAMVKRRDADGMLCGVHGGYDRHLRHIRDIIGPRRPSGHLAALAALILPKGTFFLADTHVTPDPTVEDLAATTALAAAEVRRFGIEPKIAFLSHSNFGMRDTPSSRAVRDAVRLLADRAPDLEIEGEMQGDAALSEELRLRIFPNARLKGQANLLIFPNLDAANIAFNLLKTLEEGPSVGPILLGAAAPAHILTASVTARGIVNMSALACVEAQTAEAR